MFVASAVTGQFAQLASRLQPGDGQAPTADHTRRHGGAWGLVATTGDALLPQQRAGGGGRRFRSTLFRSRRLRSEPARARHVQSVWYDAHVRAVSTCCRALCHPVSAQRASHDAHYAVRWPCRSFVPRLIHSLWRPRACPVPDRRWRIPLQRRSCGHPAAKSQGGEPAAGFQGR